MGGQLVGWVRGLWKIEWEGGWQAWREVDWDIWWEIGCMEICLKNEPRLFKISFDSSSSKFKYATRILQPVSFRDLTNIFWLTIFFWSKFFAWKILFRRIFFLVEKFVLVNKSLVNIFKLTKRFSAQKLMLVNKLFWVNKLFYVCHSFSCQNFVSLKKEISVILFIYLLIKHCTNK